MAKWEYMVIDSKDAGLQKAKTIEEIQTYLNSLGAKGWEIIKLDFGSSALGAIVASVFVGLAKRPRP
jgi:hypothetical protein